MKLIQVSDTHFVPPGRRLLGLDPRARLEACIDDINRNHGDAELCLFTGDLADSGMTEAYRVLGEVLAGLGPPFRLLIGNHDDRGNFLAAFPQAPRDENGFVQTVVGGAAGDLILLDTHEPGTAAGGYCARRCAWLRARLEDSGERPVYLFMHHPPFDIGVPSLDRIRLLEPEGFAEVVAGAEAIKHIFFGHVHRPVSGSWQGVPFSALRSTVHQVPFDTVTAHAVPYSHDAPAYGVILLEADRVVVHHHDYLNDKALSKDVERVT
jgi:3',5'-cyclic AMP phosphodiesterase CpdA